MEERADTLLRHYVAAVQPHYRPSAVELAASGPLADGLAFTGRVDALQAGPDGQVTCIDFKTASKPWREGDEHHKDQASAYIWLLGACAPKADPTPERVTFVVLSPAGVSFRPTTRTPRQLDTWQEGVQATAARIVEAKAGGDFPARTGPLCGWCSCLHACPDGRQWLKDHGRAPAVPMLEVTR